MWNMNIVFNLLQVTRPENTITEKHLQQQKQN